MKKLLFLVLMATLMLTGCKSTEEKEREELKAKQEALEHAFGNMAMSMDSAVTASLVKTWNVMDSDTVFVLEADGSGTKNEEELTFECAVTEENEFLVKFTMTADESEEMYYITTDTTGYGIVLTAVDESEELHLIQADVELLDIKDERCSGLVGTWEDQSGNLYEFTEDYSFVITDSEEDVLNGTFGVVKHLDTDILSFSIKMPSGSLEFDYEFEDDGNTLKLCNSGADSYHYWSRQ